MYVSPRISGFWEQVFFNMKHFHTLVSMVAQLHLPGVNSTYRVCLVKIGGDSEHPNKIHYHFVVWGKEQTPAIVFTTVHCKRHFEISSATTLVTTKKLCNCLPIKVPRKNGKSGTSITGDVMLMNQLGRNGVMRRKMM